MKALLLSAGLGTRLKPFTLKTPKCLIKINGKPLLEHWLQILFASGISEILINTHYLAEQVEAFVLQSEFKNKISISYEQSLLGTGGTLLQNKLFFENEDFLVAHSDNFCICDFRNFIEMHFDRPKETLMTMMTFITDKPETCGIVELNKEKVVKEFYEKVSNPPSSLANAAVYIISSQIFNFIEKNSIKLNDISLDLIPCLNKKIFTWHNNIYNKDIGTPETLKECRQEVGKFNYFIDQYFNIN